MDPADSTNPPDLATVDSPESPALPPLCDLLWQLGHHLEQPGAWPGAQLAACGQAGVYEWFLPPSWGGQAWRDADVIRGYLALAESCLTTTFVITQRMGACRRIAASGNEVAQRDLLPALVVGTTFATVGISHLTTSRRHVSPVLRARPTARGFVLDGYSPWVTGAAHADHVVLGASLDDGREILVAAPMATPGIVAAPPEPLVGLNASWTGAVRCEQAEVDRRWLLAGPVEHVMQQGVGARTGGLETSTLAVGLASAAVRLLREEHSRRSPSRPDAPVREELAAPTGALAAEVSELREALLAAADGAGACTPAELRRRANSLALRASQAALAAAKGAGYVVGHPAGRLCREALFFLVWSCPQPVLAANLCELAGIAG